MNLLSYPHPVLTTRAEEISEEEIKSEAFQKLVDELIVAAKDLHAYGLAAPQIGIGKHVFVYRTLDGSYETLINARIRSSKERVTHHGEACFSIPGESFNIKRFKRVEVVAKNRDGKKIVLSSKTKMQAFCLQHEVDHCEGITLKEK